MESTNDFEPDILNFFNKDFPSGSLGYSGTFSQFQTIDSAGQQNLLQSEGCLWRVTASRHRSSESVQCGFKQIIQVFFLSGLLYFFLCILSYSYFCYFKYYQKILPNHYQNQKSYRSARIRKMSDIHHHSQHEKGQSLAEGRQAIVKTKKKTKPHRKLYHEPKKSTIGSSLFGVGFQPSFAQGKNIANSDGLTFQYFADKYMDSDLDLDKLTNEMMEVIEGKIYKTQCLRIYHDELKFLSSNRNRSSSFKMNLNTLKSKAKVEESMWNQKYQMQRYLLESQEENQLARMYIMYVTNFLKEASTNQQYSKNQVIDLDQEQEVMMNNLELETSHLVKQLRQEKKRNVRQLKEIQEEIQDLRILIQQKQQLLRDYKAKICTLYIKLNNRKSSKAKQRNLSLSIKKFNNQNHKSLKEAFIGNNHFKTYSKEILEKVTSEEELVKIKFYAHGKENLSFQCLYKSKEGQLHSSVFDSRENSVEQLAEKENCEQAVVKYLLSIKFYFKSKIVGVEYRIKTDKGNKHVQIGTCLPNIQHELLTLINKEVVTLGSFWHGKEMIGVSIWYQDKIPASFRGESKIDREMKRSTKKKTALKSFDEYYV